MSMEKTKYRIKKQGTWEYLQYLKQFRILGICLFKHWAFVPDYNESEHGTFKSDEYVSIKHWDGEKRPLIEEFPVLYPDINEWFTVYTIMVMKNADKITYK